MDEKSPEISMADNAVSSSAVPYFHFIPTEAVKRLAQRFYVGTVRKKDKAWNATTPNQQVLTDREFILHRISHAIYHSLKLRDKIINSQPFDDDDAAAIMWAGAFLCCATKALHDQQVSAAPPPLNCSACGGTGKAAYLANLDSTGPECPACKGTGLSRIK